ncbi:ribonuclease [Pseudoxanthomonas daejeonensis]|uniref:Ribonuclease n=1 Tax=Pseudoxanthomonas daejeonensis TaxID=266062 RepID=A0ABQ6Z4S0_9GAMM|nr:ribonuclease domain-containing protein [Pseudoxanthomonas daejeonensis]KAF1692997.1 ribonuclease [Pseudoxanthomonas daejeonensis]UNK57390.1 ribonuclease [Pseudoxanthomonas daejeonensis]
MRPTRSASLLLVVVALAALAWLSRPVADRSATPGASTQVVDTAPAAHAEALPAFLPGEAAAVIRRIQDGGSFQHRQDGSVFGNREGRLPRHAHGYYREYTVPTPGLSHRGARRIVTGGDPPRDWYYTGDHYESFRRFQPPAREGFP